MIRTYDPSESRRHQLRVATRICRIEARFTVASTLCIVADSQIAIGEIEAAVLTLQRIRDAALSTRALAENEGEAFATADLYGRLGQIDRRVLELECMIGRASPQIPPWA